MVKNRISRQTVIFQNIEKHLRNVTKYRRDGQSDRFQGLKVFGI